MFSRQSELIALVAKYFELVFLVVLKDVFGTLPIIYDGPVLQRKLQALS